MRRFLLALTAAAALGGCVSMIENAYDSRARHECDRASGASDRGACYDRVDRNRRERRD
jgi:uncharacterized protein YceK